MKVVAIKSVLFSTEAFTKLVLAVMKPSSFWDDAFVELTFVASKVVLFSRVDGKIVEAPPAARVSIVLPSLGIESVADGCDANEPATVNLEVSEVEGCDSNEPATVSLEVSEVEGCGLGDSVTLTSEVSEVEGCDTDCSGTVTPEESAVNGCDVDDSVRVTSEVIEVEGSDGND